VVFWSKFMSHGGGWRRLLGLRRKGATAVSNDWIEGASKRLPPNSARAFAFALLCVAVATAAQAAVDSLGASLLFVVHFPAVLIAALLAGPAAGVLAIAASITVVWWAFMPPYFSFALPGFEQQLNLALFLFSNLLIVWLANTYRDVVARLRSNQRERELLMKELEHRGK